jgi:integrase
MPAIQRGHARRLPSGRWQLRYYDADGNRCTGGVFPSKSAAMKHYRDVIEPTLNGDQPLETPPQTLQELVDVFLGRFETIRAPRTVRSMRERLARPVSAYGATPLAELERMGGVLADFRATLPERYAHDVMRALRQVFAAAIAWGYMSKNPAVLAGANPEPPPRDIRVYTLRELDALEAELGDVYGPAAVFVAATGLRPQEWIALNRADVHRDERIVKVHGTKTRGSVREVPLTRRSLDALDRTPARITRILFADEYGERIDLYNFRRRVWSPAVEAAGIARPARVYDLRSTFASNALAANVTVFELAKIMGTSVRMIEKHYGALIGGAHAGIAGRLDALEAQLELESESSATETL